jgi:hypothetical protein
VTDVPPYNYFHATKEMAWILEYSKITRSPMFFDYSLYMTDFQVWNDDDDVPSKPSDNMEDMKDFNYENTGLNSILVILSTNLF